ncbi:MAG: bifunctional 5,10-methylenetetrahydrofolate dehydrogenase/5,10-methenyltetrahydrofolate cyclohydrolase [Parcubacteria group bacterium]|nr:bifunctional 5,10-methylenetetrahydrofolate dehydrogenase/5,10-methenyltetrahydrofolate cyclohydrolase [Parcubacteria group bacterium]
MLIDGRKIADKLLEELRQTVLTRNLKLKLAAILIGQNTGSKKFLELKQKACQKVGVDFKLHEFPENISNNQLRKELNKISKVKTNSGVILELPLPSHLNTQYLLNAIPEEKDVDMLSEKAQGAFFTNRSEVLPPSVETIKNIFEELKINPKEKNVAVFGYGLLVGKPVTHWLIQQMATVTVINEFTKNPGEISKNSDIIISGVGRPNLITADMVKDKTIVIDFGFNESLHNNSTTISGDVEFESVSKKASWITPVPGGVGPIVIASVLKNLVTLSNIL